MRNKRKIRELSKHNFAEYFSYDPKTGDIFLRKQRPHDRLKVGTKLGYKHKTGHLSIFLHNKSYLAHRIAWKLYYKEEPPPVIDHINGNPSDNRIVNLRASCHRQNGCNKIIHRRGKIVGAHQTREGTWKATVGIGDNKVYLGTFKTEREAHNMYKKFVKFLEWEKDTKDE